MNNNEKQLYEDILKILIKELPLDTKVNYKQLATKIAIKVKENHLP